MSKSIIQIEAEMQSVRFSIISEIMKIEGMEKVEIGLSFVENGLIELVYAFGPFNSTRIVYRCRLFRTILTEDKSRRHFDASRHRGVKDSKEFFDMIERLNTNHEKIRDIIRGKEEKTKDESTFAKKPTVSSRQSSQGVDMPIPPTLVNLDK